MCPHKMPLKSGLVFSCSAISRKKACTPKNHQLIPDEMTANALATMRGWNKSRSCHLQAVNAVCNAGLLEMLGLTLC